jgi:hypothetical protein
MAEGHVDKETTYPSLFTAACGHSWIGSNEGSYACPVCGLHDGDHHLTSQEEFPVQADDFATGCWEALRKKSDEVWNAKRD